jgi:hypothetical protein
MAEKFIIEGLEPRLLLAGPDEDLAAWFRADSLALSDGSPVASWSDLSGSGFHATQADPSRRPVLVDDEFNGQPAVRFDAGRLTQLAVPRPVQGDFSLVVVFRSEAGAGKTHRWYEAAGLVDAEVTGVSSDFGLSINSFGQVVSGKGAPDTFLSTGMGFNDGRPHVAIFTRAASTGAMSLYVDGRHFQTSGGGTGQLNASPRLTLGSLQTDLGYYSGDMAEIRIYGDDLTGAERLAVEAEIRDRYGIGPAPTEWFTDPVITSNFPDPGVLVADGMYYAFSTNSSAGHVPVRRSSDLVTWTSLGNALPTLPAWARSGRTWAPDVERMPGGTYNLYYTAWHAGTGRQVIGVATSSNPAGPYTPAGSAPLVSQFSLGGAIDPSVYTDPLTRTKYLLWKNDGNAVEQDTWIHIQQLSADGLSLIGSPTQLISQTLPWEGSLVEGPVIWPRGGKYYLFYSANFFGSAAYATGFAVSDSLLGPYVKSAEPLARTENGVIGPGGPEIVTGPDGRTWMLYHSWEGSMTLTHRSLSVDRLRWVDGMPVLRGPGRVAQPAPKPPRVVGRWVFYNNSAFDGFDPGFSIADNSAIATDKSALLPGMKASFANYTSYSKGINGVMIDVRDLGRLPTREDFEFRVSSGAAWTMAPDPSGIMVRFGAGVGGADRVTVVWPDSAIRNRWLRVRMRGSEGTGLKADDIFYFGNAVGESGNSAANAVVNGADRFAARRNRSAAAAITSAFDFDRDGQVNRDDEWLARDNQKSLRWSLKLITAPRMGTSGGPNLPPVRRTTA